MREAGRDVNVWRGSISARRFTSLNQLPAIGGVMSAYVIVDIDVHDPAGFEEYRRQVPASLAKHGGRFVVRGGAFQVLEGSWAPKRLVVLEVPSVEQARRWYDSEDYRPLKASRMKTSAANLILVEGA